MPLIEPPPAAEQKILMRARENALIHNNIPQPGDIGLTRVSGFLGWFIRIAQFFNGDGFTGYEHAFLVLEDGMLIEAMPGGAQIVSLSEYDGCDVLYVRPKGLTVEQRHDICAIARLFEGIPYSFVDYLAIAAHRLRLPFPGLRDFVASTGHMLCSQLVDRVYALAGIPLFRDRRWDGFVTPGSLARNPELEP